MDALELKMYNNMIKEARGRDYQPTKEKQKWAVLCEKEVRGLW